MTERPHLTVHRAALREAEAAAQFYETTRTGLGQAFRFQIDAVFDAIIAHPHMYQRLPGGKPYRRAFVSRFPFVVVYRADDIGLTVLAIFPTRFDAGRLDILAQQRSGPA